MKKTNQIRFYERDRMKVQRPVLMWTLFVIYLAVMTWIVLFKFAVSRRPAAVYQKPESRAVSGISDRK